MKILRNEATYKYELTFPVSPGAGCRVTDEGAPLDSCKNQLNFIFQIVIKGTNSVILGFSTIGPVHAEMFKNQKTKRKNIY